MILILTELEIVIGYRHLISKDDVNMLKKSKREKLEKCFVVYIEIPSKLSKSKIRKRLKTFEKLDLISQRSPFFEERLLEMTNESF